MAAVKPGDAYVPAIERDDPGLPDLSDAIMRAFQSMGRRRFRHIFDTLTPTCHEPHPTSGEPCMKVRGHDGEHATAADLDAARTPEQRKRFKQLLADGDVIWKRLGKDTR